MWVVDEGIIGLEKNDGSVYYPSVDEIFAWISQESINIDGIVYPSVNSISDLRFSKIGLSTVLVFDLNTVGITMGLFAKKGTQYYPIKRIEHKYVGYVIVENAWHYISNEYQQIQEILDRFDCESEVITYTQYMNVIRAVHNSAIVLEDHVKNQVEELKDESEQAEGNPKGLMATLFPYQKSGFNWMQFMSQNGCGCILGDEMGLGKTLQIITLIGKMKEQGKKHFLVVAPVSLLVNWEREIEKFFPSISTFVFHGSRRTGDYKNLLGYDVVIMSYSNVRTDMSMLGMITWDAVILDEAQNIKNPEAVRTLSVKQLKRRIGIAVSGTPFENHMTDIWSIVDFVFPNYLGTLSEYNKKYGDDDTAAAEVESYLSPIMLRRLVRDVAKDLPERVDIPQPIVMTEKEAMNYERERAGCKLSELKEMSLEKIQKLRMFCTHPIVYDNSLLGSDPVKLSNKYLRFCEILEEIFANKEKAIVFTSFNKMFDIMQNDIKNRFGINAEIINGGTRQELRQEIIDEFSNKPGAAVLLLNPKAAGAGLNITAANHVIHYNLEWNPAIEDQASARAYRRGQTKTVFVHRLYYADTVEEIINDKIQRKRALFNTAIVGTIGDVTDKEDLMRALSISPCGGAYAE